jgi:hypothetical protein
LDHELTQQFRHRSFFFKKKIARIAAHFCIKKLKSEGADDGENVKQLHVLMNCDLLLQVLFQGMKSNETCQSSTFAFAFIASSCPTKQTLAS